MPQPKVPKYPQKSRYDNPEWSLRGAKDKATQEKFIKSLNPEEEKKPGRPKKEEDTERFSHPSILNRPR